MSFTDIVSKFNQRADSHSRSQTLNPFSDRFDQSRSPSPRFSREEYGKPVAGSKTDLRGRKAKSHICREILELCTVIHDVGTYNAKKKGPDDEDDGIDDGTIIVSFGELFQIYTKISDKVVGLLIAAKRRGFVFFDREILFQRQDDDVLIALIKPITEIEKTLKADIAQTNAPAAEQTAAPAGGPVERGESSTAGGKTKTNGRRCSDDKHCNAPVDGAVEDGGDRNNSVLNNVVEISETKGDRRDGGDRADAIDPGRVGGAEKTDDETCKTGGVEVTEGTERTETVGGLIAEGVAGVEIESDEVAEGVVGIEIERAEGTRDIEKVKTERVEETEAIGRVKTEGVDEVKTERVEETDEIDGVKTERVGETEEIRGGETERVEDTGEFEGVKTEGVEETEETGGVKSVRVEVTGEVEGVKTEGFEVTSEVEGVKTEGFEGFKEVEGVETKGVEETEEIEEVKTDRVVVTGEVQGVKTEELEVTGEVEGVKTEGFQGFKEVGEVKTERTEETGEFEGMKNEGVEETENVEGPKTEGSEGSGDVEGMKTERADGPGNENEEENGKGVGETEKVSSFFGEGL